MPTNTSIAAKLTWMNIAVTTVALLVASVGFLFYDQSNARTSLVTSLSTQAQIIAANSVSALEFNDPESARQTLRALAASPNVEGAGLLTPDGQLFAEYWRSADVRVNVLPSLSPDKQQTVLFFSEKVTVIRNIDFGGRRIGAIYIRSNLSSLNERRNRFLKILFFVLLACMGAALIVSWLFRRTVAGPIAELADTAMKVSREKNYSLRAQPSLAHDELSTLITAFNEMLSQIQVRDAALLSARSELELRVQDRTKQLVAANRDLEAFSYSVSHDLRGPLEVVNGMSYIIHLQYGNELSPGLKDCLDRIDDASKRMNELIEDLLNLARVTKSEMHRERVDVSAMAREIFAELKQRHPQRVVEIVVASDAIVVGDAHLLRVAMDNLIGNAWKYSSNKSPSKIEFGVRRANGTPVYFIKDNGAGFDPRGMQRLFQPFQRLHPLSEFPGTGVGLATVQRIIQKHGGRIWAEGAVNEGATFSFTLDNAPES
ncbi:periplasmic sensor signal transduction histidine kinase [Candidatus Koribacter versatilis Ellin345]|uniref:histidine kinase n=1 Tax=Koribacter versatilis (strain Ellin345) TaxID=204669 RepID=Q1IT59_KORVE|nr:ATP-binding protein [Candidatus Koribacter versatilis]ABF39941.1 periplasmic sensor signal transduction histidine kinase [Candidatus Koribacter versatilis Ellin345]